MSLKLLIYGLIFSLSISLLFGQEETHIRKKKEIQGGIAPKSVVISSTGIVAAQNMMYRHSVTVYTEEGNLMHKIKDDVNLNQFGYKNYQNELVKGAPVEGAFTSDGKFLWVSNYAMEGRDFENKGCDDCIGKTYDPGFLYKINMTSSAIENVIEVGSVPKHLAISTNDSLMIIANWVSSDVSVIDLTIEKEIKRIHVGPHPRGVAINSDASKAYIAIMGSSKVAVLHLNQDYSLTYINNIGKAPRSLALGPADSLLYISLNSESKVVKYDIFSGARQECITAAGPRSMTLSPDGLFIYVVNYFDDQFTKIETSSMRIAASMSTSAKPIGICANWNKGEIWVACYSGKIEVFRDFKLVPALGENWLAYGLSLIPKSDSSDRTEIGTDIDTSIERNGFNRTGIDTLDNRLVESIKLDGKSNQPLNPILRQREQKPESCDYYIIIGAFSVSENAASKKQELIKSGYEASVVNGKYNYVSITCTSTPEAAETEKSRIQASNPEWKSAWILKI